MNDLGTFSGTTMHPVILLLMVVSCFLILIVNTRYSMILMILISIMTPMAQRIEIFGLNFYVFRLIILVGWIKILFNSKLRMEKIEKIDKIVIYWVTISCIIYIIRQYTMVSLVNRLGFAYNAIGVYFLYRIFIKGKSDINTICNTLAVVSALVAICMLIEQATGRNMFYVFGGVEKFTPVRMGRLRSQGPFFHPINAGVFGAVMFPIYFSMWRHRWGSAYFGIIGALSACAIVVSSSSATPLVAGISGLAALLFWPYRNHMRSVRYSFLFAAIFLQIVMASPIWAFIKQINVIKGANALHRFELVDNLVHRFDEWFLLGTSSTVAWGKGMYDKANQYFLEATNGGFMRLLLFFMIIVFIFKMIGKKIKTISDISSKKQFWSMGSAFFVNLVAFFGISYWDQMLYVWYLLLALITSSCIINEDEDLLLGTNIKS